MNIKIFISKSFISYNIEKTDFMSDKNDLLNNDPIIISFNNYILASYNRIYEIIPKFDLKMNQNRDFKI